MDFRTTRGYELAGQPDDGLTPAMEDYLEMIYRIELEEEVARINNLSERLHVQPSSSSKMVRKLKSLDYVDGSKINYILLTETGRHIAEYLFFRHSVINEFLIFIGNTDPLLETELLEHSFKPETIEQLNGLLEFLKSDPNLRERYLNFKKE